MANNWTPRTSPSYDQTYLLQENGDFLLQENGDKIYLTIGEVWGTRTSPTADSWNTRTSPT